jgi:hypothetical protein
MLCDFKDKTANLSSVISHAFIDFIGNVVGGGNVHEAALAIPLHRSYSPHSEEQSQPSAASKPTQRR